VQPATRKRSRILTNRISNLVADSPLSLSSASIWGDVPPKRADLHCHSDASNEADEAVLNAIQCPESFSSPTDVFEQATRRSMDFVTITDHDSIDGITKLLDRKTFWSVKKSPATSPEDRCKIHLLVWGLNQEDHNALQSVADNIYRVAEIVASRRLAHAGRTSGLSSE